MSHADGEFMTFTSGISLMYAAPVQFVEAVQLLAPFKSFNGGTSNSGDFAQESEALRSENMILWQNFSKLLSLAWSDPRQGKNSDSQTYEIS